MADLTVSVAPPAWPLWHRIVFRYLCCHWVLFALPGLILGLQRSIGATWRAFLDEGAPLPSWYESLGGWIALPDVWWREVTAWLGGMSWAPFAVVRQEAENGSGDTSHAWMRVLCIVVCSILLTVLWSVLDRRPKGHPLLGRWLHLGARWWVGLTLLGAGTAKLYGAHAAGLSLDQLTSVVGDTPLGGLFGVFFAASPPFLFLVGALEVVGGVLLLHHRSALLGAIVTTVVTANILAFNLFYDLSSKLIASHLLLASILILVPWAPRLWATMISNRFSESVDAGITRSKGLGALLVVVGLVWFGVASYALHVKHGSPSATVAAAEPGLRGVWDVSSMQVLAAEPEPGQPAAALAPIAREQRWRWLAIEGGRAWVRTEGGDRLDFTYEEDMANSRITLGPAAEGGAAATFSLTLTAKNAAAALPTADPEKPVEAAQDESLVLRGEWLGRACEIQASRRSFTLAFRYDWIKDR